MDVTLRDLRYFLALADEEHLGRAAERLSVAPATLSDGIKRLERAIGVALFVRSGRGLALSDGGRALIGDAKRVVDAAAGFEAAAGTQEARADTLRVGCSGGYGAIWLHRAQGMESWPKVEIVVTGYEDPTAGLRDGSTVAGIIGGPCEIDHELSQVLLGYDPRVAAVAKSQATADNGPLTLADLDEIGWLDVPSGDPVWHRYWRGDVARGGPPERISRRCRTVQEMEFGLASGDGVCTVPKSMIDMFRFEGVVFAELVDVDPAPVRVAFRPTAEGDPRVQALVKSLRVITDGVLLPA